MRLRLVCRPRLVRFAPPTRTRAPAQPGGNLPLAELAFGERQHREIFLLVRCHKLGTVEREERPIGYVRGALVAVHEWVVTREPVRQRRRETGEIGHRIAIGMKLLWTRQRRFQQSFVAHAGAAAVLGELAVVDSERQRLFEPDDHRQLLASLRSTLRSSRMTRSASSI